MSNYERELHQKFFAEFPDAYKILKSEIDTLSYKMEEVRISSLEKLYEYLQLEQAKNLLKGLHG